jgi:hypothetical protein
MRKNSIKTPTDSLRTEESNAPQDDLTFLRNSFLDYQAVFHKGVDLNISKNLRQNVQSRLEVLLFSVNELVRSWEGNNQEAGYLIDISNLLANTIQTVSQSNALNESAEIQANLAIAIDMFDAMLKE